MYAVLDLTCDKWRISIVWPYRSAVSNRREYRHPSSNKHTTSNSHQMPDKTSKECQEAVKFERYSCPFDCMSHIRKHWQIATYLQTKVHVVPVTVCVYNHCHRYQMTGFIIEINRCPPQALALTDCASNRTNTVNNTCPPSRLVFLRLSSLVVLAITTALQVMCPGSERQCGNCATFQVSQCLCLVYCMRNTQ